MNRRAEVKKGVKGQGERAFTKTTTIINHL
jgi:hypothetical protein